MRKISIGILAVVFTAFTACMMSKNLTGEGKMISGKSLKMCAVQKKKLIRDGVLPHFWQIQADYATLLGTYTLYDIPAEGGLTYLSGKAAGSYLCVWKTLSPAYLDTPETGTASAGAATTITLAAGASSVNNYYQGMVIEITGGTGSGQFNIIQAYNGSTKVATVTTWGTNPNNTSQYKIGGYDMIASGDVSIHDSVIVTGLKVSAYNQIESVNNIIKFGMGSAAGDYEGLSIYYAKFYDDTVSKTGLSASYVKNWKGYYSELHLTSRATPDFTHRDIETQGCQVYNVSAVLVLGFTVACEIINTEFTSHLRVNVNNCTLTFQNVLFDDYFIGYGTGGTPIINFTNSFIDGDFGVTDMPLYTGLKMPSAEAGYNIISSKTMTLGSYFMSNYLLKEWSDVYQKIFGVLTNEIDLSIIDWSADFVNQTAEISARYIPDTTFYGGGTRLYYTLKFINSEVTDALKDVFGKGWLLMVQREDYEYSLVTFQKYIKNMQLYNEVGCTTEYDFTADENIIILAEDADGNEVIFVLWDSVLYSAYLSDIYSGTVYTITHCFQLWEKTNIADGLRNIFKDATTKQGTTNSPMEGSVEFNNIDNEWAVR